ncbi:hypothetical protein PPTG_13055 [Phytophthora nicotianae INRA-310]|uniref:MULE transposase domain-containing protein n=1 Tax=Phytophthora nicotianae (strain INRA-310) TaxID=761204 RepID=W2Q3E3_PHYN3|nr:hypothetical protein PPTG_13055 [Phytophthora nicotianae INRA-310]ETN07728.1 hypothetical protein PPTG_13055 [Phytophthora nicotianae INRA-310]
MMNNDFVDKLAEYIRGLEYSGNEEDSAPFTISWQKDEDGYIAVGTGSDGKPFVVGVTSKRLLSRLDRPVESFVFHVDATFKVAQVEYPVLVYGIYDRCRSFHLVALFVTSQRLETQYTYMLNSLRFVYFRVMQKALKVYYVMGDAKEAQSNAIQSALGSDKVLKILTCYYHVVANVMN